MSLDPNKTYLEWQGSEFPNSTYAKFKAPAGSTIDWGDGTVETFNTASTTVNTHTYTDGKTEHTIAISGLTSIDSSAFKECGGLISVIIGHSVIAIDHDHAFGYCLNLISIIIPGSVFLIGNRTFEGCVNLKNVAIDNGVTNIGGLAFANCSGLLNIVIPDSVKNIDNAAFLGCRNLKTIILFCETPPILGSTLTIPEDILTIYVPQSSKEAYKTAKNWIAFADKIVSDNIYLSFVRFNQKNKEYIKGKVDDRLITPTTPTADSVVTMLANGTVGTKALSEFGGKLYRHSLNIRGSSMIYVLMFFSPDSTAITTTTLINDNGYWITGATGRNINTGIGCICLGYAPLEALMISDNGNLVQFNYSSMTNITDAVIEL